MLCIASGHYDIINGVNVECEQNLMKYLHELRIRHGFGSCLGKPNSHSSPRAIGRGMMSGVLTFCCGARTLQRSANIRDLACFLWRGLLYDRWLESSRVYNDTSAETSRWDCRDSRIWQIHGRADALLLDQRLPVLDLVVDVFSAGIVLLSRCDRRMDEMRLAIRAPKLAHGDYCLLYSF